MMVLARRALLPVMLALVACSSPTEVEKPVKYRPPPPDEPVVVDKTPDKGVNCAQPTTYRDLVNPCTDISRQVEVTTVPPLILPDGGLPGLQLPPSQWPEDGGSFDVCPDVPDAGTSN